MNPDLHARWSIGSVEIPGRLVLAPMAGVSVQAFRRQGRRYGAGLVCSEMVSCAGLSYGNERTLGYLRIARDEHPLAVQIFGSEPEVMAEAARMVEDAGADLVFGHGTHTVQGVDLYQGKPILYAIGHSAFDQPGYEKSTDGLAVRVVIERKRVRRVSFVPVTRDSQNNVLLLDPTSSEGARLVQVIKSVSEVPLTIDGQEVVLLDSSRQTPTDQRRQRQ